MLSYLHQFHAGNHADILKHFVLLYTLKYLNRKEKPYSFFDTHSGRGLYSLSSEESLKTGEASEGILRLVEDAEKNSSDVPEGILPYIDLVKSCLNEGFYPGSPVIEVMNAFQGSKIHLTELHGKEFEHLSSNVSAIAKKTSSVPVLKNESGWKYIEANVPPQLKRGAVLCDPSYEEASDFSEASERLLGVHRKWRGAVILLWYPLLRNKADLIDGMKQRILSGVKAHDFHTEVLDALLCVDRSDSHVEKDLKSLEKGGSPRLYGSGMLVVNPCWGLKEECGAVLPYLAKILERSPGSGMSSVEFLNS